MRGATMRKIIAAAVLAVVALFTFGTVLPAHAAVTVSHGTSHGSLWYDTATCRAFDAGRVHVMVVDSRQADTYLRVDVRQLAHDALVAAPHEVQIQDNLNVAMDCHYTGDQGD